MSRGRRAVLFDATGTLIELREPVGESYARLARRHGVDLPAWRIEDAWKRIVAGRAPRRFPDATPEEVPALERDWWHGVVRATFRATDQTVVFDDFEAFFDELFRWYASADTWTLRPDVARTLEKLCASGLLLGLVSNFDYRLTEVLDALGIADVFDTVVLAGAHRTAKPDPKLFEAALYSLGVSAREAAYVGDDEEKDLAGARAAGLLPIDVRSLEGFAELPAHLANVSE